MTVGISEERRAAFVPAGEDAAASYAVYALAAGGAALFAFLSIIAFLTVDWPLGIQAVPPYEQLVRNAQLFHEAFPSIGAVAPDAFAVIAWSCVAGLWLVYLPLVWRLRAHPIDYRIVLGGAI